MNKQSVWVQIGCPARLRVGQTTFAAFGRVTPRTVEDMNAWVKVGERKVYGEPFEPHPPYDWAFLFTDVPPWEFGRLFVEARDAAGNVGRDQRDFVCVPLVPRSVTVQISLPTTTFVPRNFSTAGWVTDTTATMSARVEQGGNIIATGTPEAFDPEAFDWRFRLAIAQQYSGAATLIVRGEVGTDSGEDSRSINIV